MEGKKKEGWMKGIIFSDSLRSTPKMNITPYFSTIPLKSIDFTELRM